MPIITKVLVEQGGETLDSLYASLWHLGQNDISKYLKFIYRIKGYTNKNRQKWVNDIPVNRNE